MSILELIGLNLYIGSIVYVGLVISAFVIVRFNNCTKSTILISMIIEFIAANFISVLIWIKWNFSFDVMQGVFYASIIFKCGIIDIARNWVVNKEET